MKTLVAYYSLDGSTKRVAEAIAAALAADLLYIRPLREFRAKGFFKYFLGGAQASMGLTPRLAAFEFDPSAYDRILLGSPIWAGRFTPPVKSFLKNDKIQGKKIAFFYCHLGGADKAAELGKAAISRNNRFIGSLSLQDVAAHPEESCGQAVSWAQELHP
jgi:menaquinone-dependent protoporphyrinogen IX oxidase